MCDLRASLCHVPCVVPYQSGTFDGVSIVSWSWSALLVPYQSGTFDDVPIVSWSWSAFFRSDSCKLMWRRPRAVFLRAAAVRGLD